MGVRGLQTFIERYCPGGLVDVDIEVLAHEFQQRHGKKPVLVVDGMGCLNKLYTPFMPWIFGGQWVEFLEEVRYFLDAFKRVGIDLVFIFDGVVEHAKYAEWIKRRINERHKLVKIFQGIRETGKHPGPNLYQIPSGLGTYTVLTLKHLGATVYNSQIDGDTAIFQYYKKHGSFGVLGQDTDFLIYDIQNYFSINSLRYKRKLEVKMYNRLRLCEELQLHPVHLTLLACLLGNDLIPETELSQFHCEITYTSFELNRKPHISQLVPAVANFLSEMQIRCLTPEVIADLEKCVFREVPHMWGLMDKVVRHYTCTSNEPEPQPQPNIHTDVLQLIKDGHVRVQIQTLILKVVVLHELLITTSITDYTDLTMPTAELVYRPIRKRLFGLLLGVGVQDSQRECRTASETTSRLVVGVNAVKEWCFDADRSMKIEPEVIEAEPLSMPGGTPRLEDLWLKEQEEVWSLQYQAFLTCMHCQMDLDLLSCIPTHFFLLCIVLHYLHNQAKPKFLQESDVDAFLAQAVCLTRNPEAGHLKLTRVPRVDSRGVHLASLFIRGVSCGSTVNSGCNFPLKMADQLPWRFFDGKLFHLKYLLSHQGKQVEELCDWNESAAQDVYKMKRCIYSTRQPTGYQQ